MTGISAVLGSRRRPVRAPNPSRPGRNRSSSTRSGKSSRARLTALSPSPTATTSYWSRSSSCRTSRASSSSSTTRTSGRCRFPKLTSEGSGAEQWNTDFEVSGERLPASPLHLSGTERPARALHHRRRLQPELPPLFAEGLQLEPLVVLQARQERLQAVVGLHLGGASLQH